MTLRARHVGLAVWLAVCLGGLAWMYAGRQAVHASVRAGYVHDPPYMSRGPNGRPVGAAVDVFDEAARRSGIRVQWVHVPAPGTADTALRLAKFFGTSDRFWLNLQARYDLALVGEQRHDELEAIVPLAAAS